MDPPRDDHDALSLTELARGADVSPRTVRYYIAQGLIPAPPGGPGQHYGQGHLDRIALIKRLQREHLPLAEIRGRVAVLDDASVATALTDARTGDDEVRAAQALETATSPDRARALSYIRRVLDEGTTRRAGALRSVMAPPSMQRSAVPPSPPPPAAPPPAAPPAAAPPPASRAVEEVPPASTRPGAATSTPPPPGDAPRAAGLLSQRRPSPPAARYEPHVPDEYPIRGDPAPSPATPPALPFPGFLPRPMPGERSTWERIPLAADLELHVRRPLDRETNRRLDRLLAFARELFEGT